MAIYYVGAGGNDAWNGLTWATRKLTLNGAENVPVVAGDTVYVAPGVYREMLTCDVSGGAGSPITYIGDVSGENTDGVGGVVRVTGSDNDQTATRGSCITEAAQRNYRTFRGFTMDMTTSHVVNSNSVAGTNWIIEDCIIIPCAAAGTAGVFIFGANQLAWTVRRCKFFPFCRSSDGVFFGQAATVNNCGHIIENCVFDGCSASGTGAVRSARVGGITVRDCTFRQYWNAIIVSTALAAGQTVTVNNCIMVGCVVSFAATAIGEITENYNSVFGGAGADRTNTNTGANSNTYPPLFDYSILHAGAGQVSGFRFPPPLWGTLSPWSQVRAIADTGAATEDILGLTRPVTAGKRSWGAVQYVDMARDAATVRTGTASKKLADAGRDQIYVPTTAVSTVFSVYVYREANYAGVNPSMIIKQPGQADTVVTDAGAAGAWNQLTTTLTPAALPGYVVIELVSGNTAAAGNYAVYFDDLTVT